MGTQRIVRALGLLAALILAIPAPGQTHPLGNFSISQYSGIQIEPDAIAVRYFVDMAEIPTFQELQARDMPADPSDGRVLRYLRETADALKAGLVLEIDGRRLALAVRSAQVIFPPGDLCVRRDQVQQSAREGPQRRRPRAPVLGAR